MSYTVAVLNSCLAASGATINGELPTLKKEAAIPFVCRCGKEASKTFVRIKISGVFCKECTLLGTRKKREETNLRKYGNTCSLQAAEIKEKAEKTLLEKFGTTNMLTNIEIRERIKKTNIERYGVENPFASRDIQEKIKVTNIEKYGFASPKQNEAVKEKTRQTNIQKYGVPVSSMAESVKQKAIETNMRVYGASHHIVDSVKEKIRATNLQKYGTEHSFQAEPVKEKIKQTILSRYGVDHNMKSQVIKEKAKNTNMLNLSVPYPMMSKEVREKSKQTCLQRYGVENPNQSAIIQQKTFHKGVQFKEYTTPSGIIRKVQGYEPYALNILFKEFDEDDVVTDRCSVPRMCYQLDGKTRYYFPDIYIASLNKVIEVKSSWTVKLNTHILSAKTEATTKAGYVYEMWEFDKKQNLTVHTPESLPKLEHSRD